MDYKEVVEALREAPDDWYDADLHYTAANAIEALQAQLPKQGKWIRIDKHTIQCSLCRRYLDLRGVNAGRGDANYCPNCGAKMEGKNEY